MRILNACHLDKLFLHEYSILAMFTAKSCCEICAVELKFTVTFFGSNAKVVTVINGSEIYAYLTIERILKMASSYDVKWV